MISLIINDWICNVQEGGLLHEIKYRTGHIL